MKRAKLTSFYRVLVSKRFADPSNRSMHCNSAILICPICVSATDQFFTPEEDHNLIGANMALKIYF